MSVSDQRTISRISADRLRQGDVIVEVHAGGELTTPPRFTVTRMVVRGEGWYVVTETYRGRERALHWHANHWHDNPTGSVVEVDERNATTTWLSS